MCNLEELNYQHSQPLVDTSSGSGQFQVAPLKIGQLLRDHSQHKLIPTVPTRVLIRRSAAEEILNEDCLAPAVAMPNRPHILTQRVQLYTYILLLLTQYNRSANICVQACIHIIIFILVYHTLCALNIIPLQEQFVIIL